MKLAFTLLSCSALFSAAGSCSVDDTTKWNGDAGHKQWKSDMNACGRQCLGKASCVPMCMVSNGWSIPCATCFGDLEGCDSKHCLAQCLSGRTPDCAACLKAAGCDPDGLCKTAAATCFGGIGADSCTVVDAPGRDFSIPAINCTDADKTKWDGDAGHKQWQRDITTCGTKCLGQSYCVLTCMVGKGWSKGCATCFGKVLGRAPQCLAKCAGGRTPECCACLKAAGCACDGGDLYKEIGDTCFGDPPSRKSPSSVAIVV